MFNEEDVPNLSQFNLYPYLEFFLLLSIIKVDLGGTTHSFESFFITIYMSLLQLFYGIHSFKFCQIS